MNFSKEVTWNLNGPEINVVLFGDCFLFHSIMDEVVNDSLSFGKYLLSPTLIFSMFSPLG